MEIYQCITLPGKKVGYRVVQTLSQGESFGEENFFTGQSRKFSVRSCGFSTMLWINRNDFINVVKNFAQDYEQFCFIKDSLILNSQYQIIGQSCLSCGNSFHDIFSCPYLHYVPRNLNIILKYKAQFKNRKPFQRKLLGVENAYKS